MVVHHGGWVTLPKIARRIRGGRQPQHRVRGGTQRASSPAVRSVSCCAAIGLTTLTLMLCVATGCARLPRFAAELPDRVNNQPSHHRRWKPYMAIVPYADGLEDPSEVTVRNVRQCRWISADHAKCRWSDWTIRWDHVCGVDFIVVPFPDAPSLAHTMLSFDLGDGRHLVASVEARLEVDESYSALAGSVRQYELMYVLGDETDLLGLRAEHRRNEVYLYPSIATPAQASALLRHVLARANDLSKQPEYYDSLTNNCTTNLVAHIEHLKPGSIPRNSLENLLPGHSDALAYRLGLLKTRLPFVEARKQANVSMRIRQHLGQPDFSKQIRDAEATSRSGSVRGATETRRDPLPKRILVAKGTPNASTDTW